MPVDITVSPIENEKIYSFRLLLDDEASHHLLTEIAQGDEFDERFDRFEDRLRQALENYAWKVELQREDRELVSGTVTLPYPVPEDTVRAALIAAWYEICFNNMEPFPWTSPGDLNIITSDIPDMEEDISAALHAAAPRFAPNA